mmetsp:Transcript_112664/g.329253  ORF Transcript_112664/g.329253 Transcript_112664/m.329253 type:complete len:283 (-) Transcript_112664:467-1315(-)
MVRPPHTLLATTLRTWVSTMAVSALSQRGPSTGRSFTSFSAGMSSLRAFSRQSPARGRFAKFTHSPGPGQRPKIRMTRPLPEEEEEEEEVEEAFVSAASDSSGFFPACAHAARAPSTVSLTTAWAELHHLSTTHSACLEVSFGASCTPGSTASSSKACGPQRSQKAAASSLATSSHVGSAAHLPREAARSSKSLRASERWPCESSSSAWPAVSWKPWSLLSWTARIRLAFDHRERRQVFATRKNCWESQVTSSEPARKKPTGNAESWTTSTTSALTLHGTEG